MASVNIFSLMGKIAVDGVEQTTKDLEEVSRTGQDTEGKLGTSFTNIANKAGELGKKAAIGIAGIATAAVAAVEGTREFRQDLGRLIAGYETVGHSSETAKEAFKGLYAILGEDDTAIEASNLMKELAKDEEGLAEWTNIATGVYARFPDSIPIEALIESANETAKVGQITGNLADAINWAKASNSDWQKALGGNQGALSAFNTAIKEGVSAEDAFNVALASCNSETEREALLRSTMNTLYGKSAEAYKETNKSVMDNNTAQAELNLKMAEMAEKLEPLVTKGKIFLAEVLEKIAPALQWAIDNINILAPIVLTFVGGLLAMGIAGKVANFINTIKTLKTAFAALNLTMSLNPIALVIVAVVALVAIFVTLWNKCEGFRNFWINLWEKIKNTTKSVVDAIGNFFTNMREKIVTTFNNVKSSVVNIATNIKNGIVERFNALKNSVTTVFNNVKNAITKPIETARDVIRGIVDKIKSFFSFTISFPKIKLPHFSIKPSGWKIGDLLKGSIPKLGIDWYAKAMNNPMLLEDPTAFGFSSSGNIRVGGEAGDEIVGGANTIMGMIGNAVSSNNGGIEEKLDRLITLLNNYLPAMQNQQVVLSTGELVGALTVPIDKSLGELADFRRRGR